MHTVLPLLFNAYSTFGINSPYFYSMDHSPMLFADTYQYINYSDLLGIIFCRRKKVGLIKSLRRLRRPILSRRALLTAVLTFVLMQDGRTSV
jgi:hypothetical protein